MKTIKLFLILSIILPGVFAMENNQTKMKEMLPYQIDGWTIGDTDHEYTKENLYEYINGGAELFISYSFEKCFTRIYTREEHPDISIDIFDMGSSYNAFGIFAHSKESTENDYGQGSETSSNVIIFWKDHYFISLFLSYEDKKGKKTLEKLAKQIESNIIEEGEEPYVLRLLPQKSIIKESIRFFHNHVWQNTYYFIADSNILKINNNTEAILVKYQESNNRSLLLIVKYPENTEAQQAYNEFTRIHFPSSNIYQVVPSGTHFYKGCMLNDNIISLIFNSTKEKHILEIFKELYKNIRKTN